MASSAAATAAASLHLRGGSLRFKNLLIVIKQTAFEEYSQVRASKKDEVLLQVSESLEG
jgi:hypothetical protein